MKGKRKWVLYGAVVVVFLVLWGLYLRHTAATAAGHLGVALGAMAAWLLLAGLVMAIDYAAGRERQRALRRAGNTDALTGLYTGLGMEHAIDDAFRKKPMARHNFLCLDIVAFHRFNNTFGHTMGDKLLRQIADVLRANYLFPARTSGDVFALMYPAGETDVLEIENRLREAVRTGLGAQYLRLVSFNFGVYPVVDEGRSFQELYDGALLAMKNAKAIPGKSHAMYDVALQRQADEHKAIEMNMLQALSREEFEVYIQPKYTVPGAHCCGGEALVRWQSSSMGFLMPDRFVPLFEKNGFIVEVDFFVLETALKTLQARLDAGKKPYTISVNQSWVTITFPHYFERLKNLVEWYSVPLELIELEITETAFQNDYDNVVALVHSMRALGFSVAIDDFGAGYSSLNTLREIPVNVLKIDKDFLLESDNSDRSRKIIRHIIDMSKDLDISVVCEGVESPAQFEFLKSAGCDFVQGFYFAQPLPLAVYEEQYFQNDCTA